MDARRLIHKNKSWQLTYTDVSLTIKGKKGGKCIHYEQGIRSTPSLCSLLQWYILWPESD